MTFDLPQWIVLLMLTVALIFCALDNWSLRQKISELTRLNDDTGRWNEGLTRTIDRLQAERDELLRQKQSLTQSDAEVQHRARRGLTGAELRRLNDRENATKPEPTQAEKLAN